MKPFSIILAWLAMASSTATAGNSNIADAVKFFNGNITDLSTFADPSRPTTHFEIPSGFQDNAHIFVGPNAALVTQHGREPMILLQNKDELLFFSICRLLPICREATSEALARSFEELLVPQD